jgi:hypothetical protein
VMLGNVIYFLVLFGVIVLVSDIQRNKEDK